MVNPSSLPRIISVNPLLSKSADTTPTVVTVVPFLGKLTSEEISTNLLFRYAKMASS
jgi:hypothetical protein